MSEEIILASASPRRRELLHQIHVRHRVLPVEIDETPGLKETPYNYVYRMASEKSQACLAAHSELAMPVLAADTAVILGRQILGKPRDREDAYAMLKLLSDSTHQVYSAVSLRGSAHEVAVSITEVTFKPLSDDEIEAYCRSGEPLDKAGSYAIQGLASVFIRSIKGSFSGVMGLPLYETAELLSRQGIKLLHE